MAETTYPIVHRVSDPLLIRSNRFTLQVNDVTYYAKIKFGIGFCGFLVYTSGIGYNVHEYKDEALTQQWSGNSKTGTNSKEIIQELEQRAQDWIDVLESAVLEHKPDNAIKKAIDRMCWQMHYDLTESNTDFTQFDDFADVEIDKTTEQHTVNTVRHTLTSMATTIGTSVGDGANVIIGNSTDSNGLWLVSNNITQFKNALADSTTGVFKTQIGDKLVASDDDTCVGARLNKIATNLRADADGVTQREYTISKALRDVTDNPNYSVSYATYQQTQLEQQHFTTISNDQLGAFGTGGHGTLYATLGTASDADTSPTVFGKVAAVKAETNSIKTDTSGISSIGQDTSSIKGSIGGANTANTMWYDILHNSGTKVATAAMDADSTANKISFMRELMYGDGTTGGYVTQGTNTYYVKTSD